MTIESGKIVLVSFPNSSLNENKIRPALIISKTRSNFDDWLICLISTKTQQAQKDFDETIEEYDSDYAKSGLKKKSVVRLSYLFTASQGVLIGSIGRVSPNRFGRIKTKIAWWIQEH